MTQEQKPAEQKQDFYDEEGRRHRVDAPYLLPKDDKEIQRLDYQHFIFRQVLQGNSFAPVDALLKKGCRVLDVGCGTGRWGHEIAASHSETHVIGFDLEDVPRTISTPLNYEFCRGNIFDGLPFSDQHFHYVHQRLLVAGLPLTRWPSVVRELKRVTHQGGWVELVEMGNGFHDPGPATKQFLAWWVAISGIKGIDASKVSQIGTLLQNTGFSDVRMETKRLSVGSWGGRLGNLLAQDILAGWPSMRPLAHSQLGIQPKMFNEIIGRLETEWNTCRTTYEVYFACGKV